MATILGETNFFFKNWDGHYADTLRIQNFVEIALPSTVFMFCNFCEKFENSKWPPDLARKNILKIEMATLQRYPVGQKFCRNRSISHGFRDISIFVFSLFGKLVMIN